MTAITNCKKCKGTGKNRAGDCGTCKGSGRVSVVTDKDGNMTITPALKRTSVGRP